MEYEDYFWFLAGYQVWVGHIRCGMISHLLHLTWLLATCLILFSDLADPHVYYTVSDEHGTAHIYPVDLHDVWSSQCSQAASSWWWHPSYVHRMCWWPGRRLLSLSRRPLCVILLCIIYVHLHTYVTYPIQHSKWVQVAPWQDWGPVHHIAKEFFPRCGVFSLIGNMMDHLKLTLVHKHCILCVKS